MRNEKLNLLIKLCRLCGNETENSINLFDRSEKKRIQQIESLTGEKLKFSKCLPYLSCQQCLIDLDQAFAFRLRCQQTESYFKSEIYKEKVKTLYKIGTCKEPKKSTITTLSDENAKDFKEFGELKDESFNEEINRNTVDDEIKRDYFQKQHGFKKTKKRKKYERLPNVFICDQCGNQFTCRHHFETHLKRHIGDKQFQCELCSQKFFTPSELKRHMRRHTGERPFACKHCDRRFTDCSSRVKHERTHTNERPFRCVHCSKAFTTTYILKNHLLTHTGQRKFICSICEKSFLRDTHLVVHYRSVMHKRNVEKRGLIKTEDGK